jgi:hypothetical protein
MAAGAIRRLAASQDSASSHPSAAYEETRVFYARCGFDPLETFEGLWG